MNYVEGTEVSDEEDLEDDEDVQTIKKNLHNKKIKNHQNQDASSSKALENERVRKALLLAVESRKDQARLGNKV